MTNDTLRIHNACKAYLNAQSNSVLRNNPTVKCSVLATTFSRRKFLKLLNVSFIASFLPACNDSSQRLLQAFSDKLTAQQLFNALFPAEELGLTAYAEDAFLRVQQLSGDKTNGIAALHQDFKARLLKKRFFGLRNYQNNMGVATVASMLQSPNAERYNHALDIIYQAISNVEGLAGSVWGRAYSQADKKCAYWDNYDQPVP